MPYPRLPTDPHSPAAVHTRHWRLSNAAQSAYTQGAILLVVAFALRFASFGDPHLHIDEAFYFLVGQEMHAGALPYVDIWDRKPLGLFLIYWAIAGISTSVVAYQIAATVFAAGTALTIARIAGIWSNAQGALLAALLYLIWLAPLLGFGGQAPVFYNLPIALAFLLLVRSWSALKRGEVPPRVYGAMLLGGLALTIKQTAIFECLTFGLLVLVGLLRAKASLSTVARTVILSMLLGLAPMAAIGAWYWLHGHWPEFWMAMTKSSFERPPLVGYAIIHNLKVLAQLLFFPVLLAFGGFTLACFRRQLFFIALTLAWALAAILGLASIRLIADHHALPLLMPLAVAASPLLSRKWVGPALIVLLFIQSAAIWFPFNFALHRQSAAEMSRMAAFIRDNREDRGLFVFDGPPLLYAMSGTHPLSPLVFPTHFTLASERNISQFNTEGEMLAILAKRPGVVVVTDKEKDGPQRAMAALHDYTQNRCHVRMTAFSTEPRDRPNRQILYGQCR